MKKTRFLIFICFMLMLGLIPWGANQAGAQYVPPPQLVPGVNYSLPNYANSPIIRKFVDSVPGLTLAGGAVPGFFSGANNLTNSIPVAVAMGAATPAGVPLDSAYYEIALVEYTQQMHSDLGPTKLRGYVQIEPPGAPQPANSLHVPLAGITFPGGAQVFGYTKPSYLGPVIVATKGTPTRIKFYNLLPVGAGGNLFIPTDVTVMGAGMGADGSTHSQNRATLHLHGGDNPWISDGTAHQWITPNGQAGTLTKGAAQQNVSDMPIPANGSATFYWPNGQSGRLMFYHDHAMGITRLNVYAGEAAGYLLVDPQELGLNTTFGVAAEVPLVIQDKSFVNNNNPIPAGYVQPVGGYNAAFQTSVVDPLWATHANWGQTSGSLWLPHVYMPNQNPNDLTGANPWGRWDYGNWFWPIFPVTGPPPEVSIVPESFMDTPVINGTAYPFVSVNPTLYRFRILNACNDRFVNLQLYVADPGNVAVTAAGALVPGGTAGSFGTEVRMIPAIKGNGSALGALDPGTTWPAGWIANDTLGMIPDILDGRQGGVPDPSPSLMGPSFIQIGTEGGLLPVKAVLDNTPVGYVQNKRDIVIGNIGPNEHTLLLGPAERADVLIDFSQFAGKTLILYNDSPAPVPAADPRYDYYTGNLDYTANGGAYPTQAGFGPNTRTMMQIRVGGAANGPAFNSALVDAPLAAAFAATQPALIVPPGSTPGVNVAKISDNSLNFSNPAYGLVAPVPLQPKTIQELFDPLGRMNATLGVELPFTTALLQTTIPYGFADPVTEVFNDGETQLWKITHNGVDTHAIHFHLFNVQVVNRVGWDGAIRLPEANEKGWKETVRMSPLEDIVVALKAKTPTVPFDQPNSVRYYEPVAAPHDTTPFLGVDPNNIPVVVTNELANFGDEYTWHCHLLGHEENDMMRATSVARAPRAPTALTGTLQGTGAARSVVLNWTDNSMNETAFTIQRATNLAFTTGVTTLTSVLPDVTTYTDVVGAQNFFYRVFASNTVGSMVAGFPVRTVNSANSNVATPTGGAGVPTAPTNLRMTSANATTINLSWTDRSNNETSFAVWRSTNGGAFTQVGTVSRTALQTTGTGGNVTFQNQGGISTGNIYQYYVTAVNAAGPSPQSNTITVATLPPAAPSSLTGSAVVIVGNSFQDRATLTWTDNANNETGFTIQRRRNGVGSWTNPTDLQTFTVGANVTTLVQNVAKAFDYVYRVRATNAFGNSGYSNDRIVTTP